MLTYRPLSFALGITKMSSERYVYAVNLDTGEVGRGGRPEAVTDLTVAEISAPGKCATVHLHQGVAYVGAHSRCAVKLWRIASGSDDKRPNVPWVAYRGMTKEEASNIAWAWLEKRGLFEGEA